MENPEILNRHPKNTPFILLILSISFSFYYIDLGFALKPFMILAIVFFVFSLKEFVVHKLRIFEVCLLMFFSYYILTGMLSEYPEYSLRMILGVILMLFCYFVIRYITSIASVEGIEKGISIGGIVFNGLSLLLYLAGLMALNFVLVGNQIREYGVLMDRGFPRLTGLTSDPNIFCFYNLVFFFYYLTHMNQKWSKIGILLSSMTMVLSMSRGGIIAIIFGLILIFFTSNIRQKIKLLIITPISFFLVNFIINKFFYIDIIEQITNRFTENDGGSGRLDLWNRGLYFFQENPIFGIGIFNYRPYSNAEFGSSSFMHNTFLEVLTEGGLVGIIFYLMIFITVVISYIVNRSVINDKGYLIITFVSMAILMSTLSMVVNEVFFVLLALLWRYLHEPKWVTNGFKSRR